MSFQLTVSLACKRLIELATAWPLSGVLATGAFSSLLWVRADLFRGHLTLFLLCIIALPIIGGILTPEKPAYSVVVFAVGSYPPLNDVPPIPIALVPFLRTYENLTSGLHQSIWQILFHELPLMVAIASLVAVVMSVLYAPLVYLGWVMRRSWERG